MLIGHINDKIMKAVEERSKDSDTSCKPTSHKLTCREMLLVGIMSDTQYKVLLDLAYN